MTPIVNLLENCIAAEDRNHPLHIIPFQSTSMGTRDLLQSRRCVKVTDQTCEYLRTLAWSHNGLLGFICTKMLHSFLYNAVKVLHVKVTWDVAADSSMHIDESWVQKLLGQLWREIIEVLAKEVEGFNRVVLPLRCLENQEQILPAAQHPKSITFFNGIVKFHV